MNKIDYTVEEIKLLPHLDLHSYYSKVEQITKDIETQFKIPAIVPIIQSAHESANGNSGLARLYCNLFGIKATDSWKKLNKPTAFMNGTEFINGKEIPQAIEWRVYGSWKDSFDNWAHLISGFSGYKKAYTLFQAGDVIDGITEMGKVYATDPQYAKSLINIYQSLKS